MEIVGYNYLSTAGNKFLVSASLSRLAGKHTATHDTYSRTFCVFITTLPTLLSDIKMATYLCISSPESYLSTLDIGGFQSSHTTNVTINKTKMIHGTSTHGTSSATRNKADFRGVLIIIAFAVGMLICLALASQVPSGPASRNLRRDLLANSSLRPHIAQLFLLSGSDCIV